MAAFAAVPSTALGQEIRGENEFPRIRIQGRMQPQFYLLDNEPYANAVGPTNQLFLRRARFRFRVYLQDNLSVMLNPSFEGSPATVRIQDAYVDIRLSKRDAGTYILLRTGQFKTRFGRYENKSSTNLPSLERGGGAGQLEAASNDLFKGAGFLGRDVGITAFFGNTTSPAHWGFGKNASGETPEHGWGLSVSMFNGQGASAADVNNNKSFGARGTYRILPKLDVGAAVLLHDGIVGTDSSFTN
ncbi:MAG: porin, partial [Gemmatimonadales bacterium]